MFDVVKAMNGLKIGLPIFVSKDIQFLKLLNCCMLLGSLMKKSIFQSNLVLNMMKILNGLLFFFP